MSSSAGNNPALPLEVMDAILRLLPVKPLGRFKSVSKAWYSLISDPQFIKNHLHQSQKTRKLISISDSKELYSLDLSDLLPCLNSDDVSATRKEVFFPIMWDSILGSCNGLVLACASDTRLFLINPATNEMCVLPPFHLRYEKVYIPGNYGFGYDSSTKDYKFVSIPPSSWEVAVYSLRNNSWSILRNAPYVGIVGQTLYGVFVNQNLHWLTKRRRDSSRIIVAFSLANEEFIEIEIPGSIEDVDDFLVDFGGRLGYFSSSVGSLWVMEEYGVGESWTKVCFDGLEIDPFGVCFVKGHIQDIVWCDRNEVRVYNMDEKRCRNVRIEEGPSGYHDGRLYFDSLESPAKCIGRLGYTPKPYDIVVNQKELKKKYDHIRGKYLDSSYLRQITDKIYNPHTSIFNLANQEWDDVFKVYPKATHLKPTPFASQWASLSSQNPTIQTLRTDDVPIDSQDVTKHTSVLNVDGGRAKKKAKHTIDLIQPMVDMQKAMANLAKTKLMGSTIEANMRETVANLAKNKLMGSTIEANMRETVANLAKNKLTGPTIDDCYDKLKGLRLEATDPVFLAAFGIFSQSNNYREAWMTLPSDPEVLKKWITMMAKALGFMK
ncbi:hypothetical protein SSX86_011747 [Deinandra increscens subsp. villosa]|uniref:F-box domain-containing protein n=1 Tax=Deinandra increscens subsp. villosa TaxID=3103831 RepID=A0AAP0GZW5_9ASTR